MADLCESVLIPHLTKNTSLFEALTPCLTFVVIPLVPLSFICLSLIITLIWYKLFGSVPQPSYNYSRGQLKKFLLSVVFVGSFATFALNGLYPQTQIEYRVSAIIDVIFAVLVTSTTLICTNFGYSTSGSLHWSWFCRLISQLTALAVLFNSLLNGDHSTFNIILSVINFIQFIISIIFVIIYVHPDVVISEYSRLDEKPPYPVPQCSAVQFVLFNFVTKLLRKSLKETISIDDYWSLDNGQKSATIHRTSVLSEHSKWTAGKLMILCFRLCGFEQFVRLLSLIADVLSRFLFIILMKYSLTVASGDFPLWLLILCTIGFAATDFFVCFSHGLGLWAAETSYLKVRTTLSSMIFEKMLKLSPVVETKTAAGIVSNYVSVDIEHNKDFWRDIGFVVFCILTISMSITLLAVEIGIRNAMVGMGMLVVFVLLNAILGHIYSKYETAQMKTKDERLRFVNDVLNGIRVLKLYGWEESIQKMIASIRRLEVRQLFYLYTVNNLIGISFNLGPALAIIASLYCYVIVDGNPLTAERSFTVLLLFGMTRFAVYKLPALFTSTVAAIVSLRRLAAFFSEEEREESYVQRRVRKENEPVVCMDNVSFSWSGELSECQLKDLTLRIESGELIGVVGAVGSGKSTLLAALAGELGSISGSSQIVASSVAYLPQTPWIQNLSLRDNVLFDSEMNVEFYESVLNGCALRDDLQLLKDGDLTEIGEKGINLSGGQKARVSLARAVYQRSDLYVLDDPLSAVDSHVAEHIFDEVLGPNGLLSESTRIISLNSTVFLKHFDAIIYLKGDGSIVVGNYQSLRSELPNVDNVKMERKESVRSDYEPEEDEEKETLKLMKADKDVETYIDEETLFSGRQSATLFVDYIRAFGIYFFITYAILLGVVSTTLRAASNLEMAKWSSDAAGGSASLENLELYALLSVGSSVVALLSYTMQIYGSFRASYSYHGRLVHSILRAPVSFFDHTPVGRLMNRFSSDIDKLDNSIGQIYGFFFILMAEIVENMMTIFIAIPFLGPVVLPMIIIFVLVVRFFNAASIQFRRISSNSLSKMFSAIQDGFHGASSIRAFAVVPKFFRHFGETVDRTTECRMVEISTKIWIRLRLDIPNTVTVLVFLVVSVILQFNGYISIGLLGMVMSSGIMVMGYFGETADIYRDGETELIAIERLNEYSRLEAEPIFQRPNAVEIPQKFDVEFLDISLRYKETDAAVLNSISFRIESGQKLGIVGRTGAGKTSLTAALFRTVEPFEGEIRIGGVDIRRMGRELRKLMTIIPQDPILFCGTLRSNLDPFGEFEDKELREAICSAHLETFLDSLDSGLDYPVAVGGTNLSGGQRQLICLARALLRRPKVLVLDEATSAVDLHTDSLIRDTIRERFQETTVLTIAHRLHTVIDYDKILVLESGRVREFASPAELLADRRSLFYGFARKAGIVA